MLYIQKIVMDNKVTHCRAVAKTFFQKKSKLAQKFQALRHPALIYIISPNRNGVGHIFAHKFGLTAKNVL